MMQKSLWDGIFCLRESHFVTSAYNIQGLNQQIVNYVSPRINCVLRAWIRRVRHSLSLSTRNSKSYQQQRLILLFYININIRYH